MNKDQWKRMGTATKVDTRIHRAFVTVCLIQIAVCGYWLWLWSVVQ